MYVSYGDYLYIKKYFKVTDIFLIKKKMLFNKLLNNNLLKYHAFIIMQVHVKNFVNNFIILYNFIFNTA